MSGFCPRPGSGRGSALGGCPLGSLGVMLRGAMCYHEALCGGTECCGALCSGGWGVAWLGSCVGGLAWAGVISATHGLGLGLLVGGLYVSLCA